MEVTRMLQEVTRETRLIELNKRIATELRDQCKSYGIKIYRGKNRLTKSEMVEQILVHEGYEITADVDIDGYDTDVSVSKDIENIVITEADALREKQRIENKMKYVENAQIGAIVAFKTDKGKVISAAITRKSTKRRKLEVTTKYGAVHVISWDDVIWVRVDANKRWPKGVYQLFKQNLKNTKGDVEDVWDDESES